MSTIPDHARAAVQGRETNRCCRCGVAAPNGHWHHRRSRSVRGQHCHCPCNGVWLCPTCHEWVHAHPFEARASGFIVSRQVAEPGTVLITSTWGNRFHDCDGNYTYTEEQPE